MNTDYKKQNQSVKGSIVNVELLGKCCVLVLSYGFRLYKTLKKHLKAGKIATRQKEWLNKRNKCETKNKISECLLSSYKKRTNTLIRRIIFEESLITPSPSLRDIKDIRAKNGNVYYLAFWQTYKWGKITKSYSSTIFKNNKIITKNSLCLVQKDEEGTVLAGDKNCNIEKAMKLFQKSL